MNHHKESSWEEASKESRMGVVEGGDMENKTGFKGDVERRGWVLSTAQPSELDLGALAIIFPPPPNMTVIKKLEPG